MCLILLFAGGCLIVLALLVEKTVPLYCSCSFVKGQLIMYTYVGLFMGSLFCSIQMSFFLANITLSCLSLDLRNCQFSDFILLPSIMLAILGLLTLHMNFKINLSVSTRQHAAILIGIALNLQIKWTRTGSLKILSLPIN